MTQALRPSSANGPGSPHVCIVVLNWNGRADTVECLRSLERLDYAHFDVIVVDNGSSDGSETAIRSQFPSIRMIQNGKNLGYAGGNNPGILAALESGAQYVVLLNNDTVVDPNLLKAFVAAADEWPGAGVFGPKIYHYGDRDRLWFAGGYWDDRTLSFAEVGAGAKDEGQFDTLVETEWVIGCCMLVRASVFRAIGLLEPRFFLNNEEIDFCSRARRAGFKCVFVPEARIWHKISVSFGGAHSPMKEYFSARNRLLWAGRNAPLRLRLRIYASTAGMLLKRFVLPLARALSAKPLSFRALWWTAREIFTDPRNRAYALGVKDFCLRRFGNCPDVVRHLTSQWVERRASVSR